jgi:hypothetical protein
MMNLDELDKLGLEQLGELDEDDMSYEWHTLATFKSKTDGTLYWWEGSGCSCNSAYDDIGSKDDLRIITKATYDEFMKAVTDFPITSDKKGELTKAVVLS